VKVLEVERPGEAKGRAVVTGGAGFVGSHLCERLLGDGWSVVCVDNLLTGSLDNVAHLRQDPDLEVIVQDVSTDLSIDGTVDAVLHLASPASPVDYLRFPVDTMRAGSLGTFNALELAREHGARFVLASTSEAYGDPQIHPQPETYWGNVNPVGPRSVYDEAKRFSEAAAMAYRRTYGLPCGIVRLFNTFGPRMRAHDGRAVPTFIAQALTGEPITVAGDGSQTRSICFVDDVISGIIAMIDSKESGPINLGNPDEASILDLALHIRDLCDSSSEIIFVPRPEDDPTIRQPDVSVAQALLGWEPTTPVDHGLRRTIDWFITSAERWWTSVPRDEDTVAVIPEDLPRTPVRSGTAPGMSVR
jgi:dTDP-glucose 4,6-dehydratase